MSAAVCAVCETCGRVFYSLAWLPGRGKHCDVPRCHGYLHHIVR